MQDAKLNREAEVFAANSLVNELFIKLVFILTKDYKVNKDGRDTRDTINKDDKDNKEVNRGRKEVNSRLKDEPYSVH